MGNIDSRNERFYNLCGLGKAHLIEKMLENDRIVNTIDINWVSFESQSTALLIASANGHELVVDILLRNNAKFTIKDSRQATALHHAAQRNYTKIAKKLLHAGCDVNAQDKLGWTPLMKACYFCSPDIILTLLEGGANIDAQTEQGRTALHELCRSPSLNNETLLAEIACILIEAGANVNQIDEDHFTPLIYAAYHNHPSVALVLLESNSLIDKTDKQGWTALHWAIDRDHSEIVQLLIDKGARTDIRSHRDELAISRVKSIGVKNIIKRCSTKSISLTDMNIKKISSNISMIDLENCQTSGPI
ncbi:unnamed protein product [Adineta steineri]|uniref:Ankyrin repeat protein n=1 Tax=Adineta steineri TaxID=433720 RepID=A0A815UMW6_9BILA|nr:unnamed protein product [Adineta steineri]CAF1649757.1 unnamed protein product [Adineta steineri]